MIRWFSAPVVAVLLGAAAAGAQDYSYADYSGRFTNLATYGVSFPVGDTHSFISQTSWMGVGMEGQWRYRRTTTVGVAVAVYDFSDETDGTTNFSSGSATGEQFRDLVSVSLMGTGRWFPRGVAGRGPYLGIGAGGLYAQQSYQLGVMPQFVHDGVHLVVAPEAGVAIPIFDGVDALVNVRYTIPSSAGRYLGGGTRSFRFVTLGIGLAEH
jgi:hypothetical protein